MFNIFKSNHFAKESSFGVSSIIKAYGKRVYKFFENFLDVILRFDDTNLVNNELKIQLETTRNNTT